MVSHAILNPHSSHPLLVQITLHSNYPSTQGPSSIFLIEFQKTTSTVSNNLEYMQQQKIFKNVGYYIWFLSLTINLDCATLTLSTFEYPFLKYDHIISQTRHNNLTLKLRSPYCCGNHQTQSPIIIQGSKALSRLLMWESQEKLTRSLC